MKNYLESRGQTMLVETHDGMHHADEAAALAILQMRYGGRLWCERIGKPSGQADFVIDLGGRYEPASGRFDHHQGLSDPSLPRPGPTRPRGYATAGLVWRRFGMRLCRDAFEGRGCKDHTTAEVAAAFKAVDLFFMAPIDNWDNGITQHGAVIPMQNLVSVMKFGHAVKSIELLLASQIKRAVQQELDVRGAEADINTDGGVQAWVFGPHMVLQSRPGESLPLPTARRIARNRYQREVLGVVSFVRSRNNSVFMLGGNLRFRADFFAAMQARYSGKIAFHHSRSMFFSEDQEVLIDLARAAASSGDSMERVR